MLPTSISEVRQDCLSLADKGYFRQVGDKFFAIEEGCCQSIASVASDVASVATPETVVNASFQENVANVASVATEEICDSPPETPPPTTQGVATNGDMATPEVEILEDPWLEAVASGGDTGGDINNSGDIAPEMMTSDVATPGVVSPNVPSGVGFAAVSDSKVTDGSESITPEVSISVAAPSTPAPAQEQKLVEPYELAARLFARGTWLKVVEELDAIASAARKTRSAIFNRLKKCIRAYPKNTGSEGNAHSASLHED